MFLRERQFRKALLPIYSTLAGIFIVSREKQSAKAPAQISVTLSGMIMLFRRRQLLKQSLLISVIESGITTSVIPSSSVYFRSLVPAICKPAHSCCSETEIHPVQCCYDKQYY